jgi:hypothetical protein
MPRQALAMVKTWVVSNAARIRLEMGRARISLNGLSWTSLPENMYCRAILVA